MAKLIEVQAREHFHLWLRYSDGVEGEVDLSDLAGHGVFALWQQPGAFDKVRLGPAGDVVWDEQVDLCPDMLYLRLTGKRPQDLFPTLKETQVHA
jgi:Protein of unknown function (DUF2442)